MVLHSQQTLTPAGQTGAQNSQIGAASQVNRQDHAVGRKMSLLTWGMAVAAFAVAGGVGYYIWESREQGSAPVKPINVIKPYTSTLPPSHNKLARFYAVIKGKSVDIHACAATKCAIRINGYSPA